MPAIKTPRAKAMPGFSNRGDNIAAKRIKTTFKIMGLNAVAQKCFLVFNTAPHRAVREIKRRYGNVNLSISTESSYRPFSTFVSVNPGANRRIRKGEKITPKRVIINKMSPNVPAVLSINSLIPSSFSFSSKSERTGMNALENEPSAKNRLKEFGTLNATKKASMRGRAPNNLA